MRSRASVRTAALSSRGHSCDQRFRVDRVPTVRQAEVTEVPALSVALTQAFMGEPVTEWMMPQRTRRKTRREQLYRVELQSYVLPHDGLVTTADDRNGSLVGACLTLPPGRWEMPTSVDGRTALRFFRAYGLKLPRAIRAQRVMAERHPTVPHYYVRWVGIRPGLRGQGLGSALMRPTLDRSDEERLPAYLEASSEASAALYERLGFVHQGMLTLPEGGPPMWPMLRPPRD
jgi:ribosomal protein S18 acetylase RimI-like enzyme